MGVWPLLNGFWSWLQARETVAQSRGAVGDEMSVF